MLNLVANFYTQNFRWENVYFSPFYNKCRRPSYCQGLFQSVNIYYVTPTLPDPGQTRRMLACPLLKVVVCVYPRNRPKRNRWDGRDERKKQEADIKNKGRVSYQKGLLEERECQKEHPRLTAQVWNPRSYPREKAWHCAHSAPGADDRQGFPLRSQEAQVPGARMLSFMNGNVPKVFTTSTRGIDFRNTK